MQLEEQLNLKYLHGTPSNHAAIIQVALIRWLETGDVLLLLRNQVHGPRAVANILDISN
jgi:hypothetical protein